MTSLIPTSGFHATVACHSFHDEPRQLFARLFIFGVFCFAFSTVISYNPDFMVVVTLVRSQDADSVGLVEGLR